MNQWIWIAIAAVAVLAALALLVVALRNWRWQGAKKGRRLGVLERVPIARDAELVLLRRDGVEHLVCLTGGGGFLVEGGIRRAPRPQPQAGHGVAPATVAPPAMRPAPPSAPERSAPPAAEQAPRPGDAPPAPPVRPEPRPAPPPEKSET